MKLHMSVTSFRTLALFEICVRLVCFFYAFRKINTSRDVWAKITTIYTMTNWFNYVTVSNSFALHVVYTTYYMKAGHAIGVHKSP